MLRSNWLSCSCFDSLNSCNCGHGCPFRFDRRGGRIRRIVDDFGDRLFLLCRGAFVLEHCMNSVLPVRVGHPVVPVPKSDKDAHPEAASLSLASLVLAVSTVTPAFGVFCTQVAKGLKRYAPLAWVEVRSLS